MALSHKCKYCISAYQFSDRVILRNDHWIGVYDKHPVSPGHMKLVSRRHRKSFDNLSIPEMIAFFEILKRAKTLIRSERHPRGWNIGINEGRVAGQTVMHLHIHLIPRYKGDVADPTGGVRTILTGGNYLKPKT